MKTMTKRLIAVLCCVVMLVTSLYIVEPQKAEAATATSTMSLDIASVNNVLGWNAKGFLNIPYTGVASDYAGSGTNFLNNAFIESYITFGGGMTAADLLEGMLTFYVANSSILQFNWGNRTTAFTEGWSFTIAKGALLPYAATSGTSYMALDKEYTFKFTAGNESYTNIVEISSVDITTWSLTSGDWGIGTNATTTEFFLQDSNVANYVTAYTAIQANKEYRGYLTIDGKDMLELAESGLKIQTVLNATDSARALQVNDWGDVRGTLTIGSAIIIREGMPFYYTDTSGTKWRAELDATYIYTCTGSNTLNSHVFSCTKYVANENAYGLKGPQYTTVQQSPTNTEQYINVYFKTSSAISGAQQSQMLDLALIEEYVDIAGYTVKDAKNKGIIFRFIPNANCIQLGFSKTAVPELTVGKMIVLKKGMPVVFNSGASSATLDSTYELTVTANNGTNLTMSIKEIAHDYSLSGTISQGSDNSYATSGYWNVFFNSGVIPEDETFSELFVDADKAVLANYFLLTGYDSATVINNGSITLKRYNISALRGLRVVYNVTDITFTDGMVMMFKKGLPITYTTTYGTKMTCLDKDYGFVYSASTGKFTYDPSLTAESLAEKFKFTAKSVTTFYEAEKYRMNVGYTSTKEAATTTATTNILKSTGNAGNTADYVDFCGMTSEALDVLGVSIILYPSSPCFQIVWGTDALSWVEMGYTVTFKAGMPVYYATGDVMFLSETVTYAISAITETSFTMVQYAESGEYALAHTQFGTGTTSASEALINIVNANTGKPDALDDANTTYVTLDADTISRYVDFCGLTAKELEACGTWIKAIRNGTTQVFQIHWGTVTEKMAINDQITFHEGLPIQYTTTEGLTKKVYLKETVVFTVATGNDGNTYVLNYTAPESFGLWAIDSGASYIVAGKETGAEGYYNNIDLFSSDLTEEVSAVRYTLTTEQLDKYVDFAGLDAATYGFNVIVIIDGDTKVVQLQWGKTTSRVKDGDEIIFKAGLPIRATTTTGAVKTFALDANCTFTIQEYSEGNNGYRIVGVQVSETSTTPGDVDGDYLLDKNDISLLKKELIGLIHVSDPKYANANADTEGTVNCADLVHALKKWNVDEKETYTTMYEGISSVTIAAGDTYTVAVNQDLGALNYLRLTFDTTENMYGTFYYSYNGSVYKEHFYLAEDEVQFKQFLDNYRANGVWGTTKVTGRTLTKVSFTNVGDAEANFLLNKIEKAERAFENSDMLYVQNNDIKIGVDLNMGGSLAWYESLKYEPVEYIDTSDRTVRIEPKADYSKESTYQHVLENVNLINIYDLGRQIQQSFYIDVQDADYENGSYNGDNSWPYNPVQAGDKKNNKSQIVDYRKIDTDGDSVEDMIYVKTRAMDWSNPGNVTGGTTTESYMENWYKLSDNLLYVDNAFVDWAGWEENGQGSHKSQELPAFYTGQALNYFVAGNDTSTRYGELGSWTGSGDSYHVEGDASTSNWYAWVNADADNAFGLGIYIPNANACTAGRCVTTNQYSKYSWLETGGSLKNRNASDALIFNLGFDYLSADSNWQNCYLYNTSYIAPTKTTILQEYTSYEYTYVLTADRLSAMSSTFDTLDESKTVTNDAMDLW